MGDREGMIARIRHVRRLAAVRDAPSPGAPGAVVADAALPLTLEARVAHLERLLEGFQDSVHRESVRQDERLGEIEARIQPAALNVALNKDARERGL
jgi:hypothetical protein